MARKTESTGEPKPPRQPRTPSEYLLLEKKDNGVYEQQPAPLDTFSTPADAWKAVIDNKLTGKFVVVCVRGERTAATHETVKFE